LLGTIFRVSVSGDAVISAADDSNDSLGVSSSVSEADDNYVSVVNYSGPPITNEDNQGVLVQSSTDPLSTLRSLDSHDIMMNLLLGCTLDNDLFLDHRCKWIHDYYQLLQQDRDSFWNFIEDHPRDSCISRFILQPFECISPELMMNIYRMYCGMVKEDQRSLLSLCYSAKCWRENRDVLRSEHFLCYSPIYDAVDRHELEDTISIYCSSSRVKSRVNFGCARCMELSSIGRSRLKHLSNCPFTLDNYHLTDKDTEEISDVVTLKSVITGLSSFQIKCSQLPVKDSSIESMYESAFVVADQCNYGHLGSVADLFDKESRNNNYLSDTVPVSISFNLSN